MDNWNGKEIGVGFDRKSKSLNPENPRSKGLKGLYDTELALQNLYQDCAMSSYAKDSLVNQLKNIINGSFNIPLTVFDEQKYKKVMISEATRILEEYQNS